MQIGSLTDMYVAELQELHSVENQLVDALARMAERAKSAELKDALNQHLDETRSQARRVQEVLRRRGANPREHVDQAMQVLVRESEKWAGMLNDPALADAGLIASAQKIEHYEIAAYGTVTAYAGLLGHEDDQRELHAILEEEKAADAKLTDLAKAVANPKAAKG
jgi:ferritin-like metal-binding protein YciE